MPAYSQTGPLGKGSYTRRETDDMKHRLETAIIMLMAAALAFGLSCSKKGEVVVARVGDDTIVVDDVVEIMSGGGYSDDLDGVNEALEHLIDFNLLLAGARAEGLDTTAEFRKDLKVMKENFFVRKLYEEVVVKGAEATEEELRAYFDEHKLGEEQVEARHILIGYREGESEELRQEALVEAVKVLEEAKAGADFAELAQTHSDGPSAPHGGYLGYFPRGRMVKPFEDAAFSLEPGEISDIVETRFGFHIVKVENRRSRDFEEMKEEIETYVEQPKRQKLSHDFMEELESAAQITYHDEAIDSMIALFETEEPAEEALAGADLVLATYNGGEWTTGRYLEFYSDFPADYMTTPSDREEVKAILNGLIRNELLIQKAKEVGIAERPEFKKELSQLEDDALVQIFIKRKVYVDVEVSDEEVKAYYEEHSDTYDRPLEEVEDVVRTDLIDERRQKRLDELTVPLREEFDVVILEENLPVVLEVLNRKG